MKTARSLYGLTLTAVLALSGCLGGSSSPPADVVVPPPAVTAPGVALQAVVKDASTGGLVTPVAPAVVTVSVYGADANKVVSYDGASLYSATNGFAGPFTTANGLLIIYVKPGTPVPSQMSLRVVASANGFVTSSDDVVIKSTDLNSDGSTKGIDVSISLVKVSAPPPSVTVVTAPVTVTAGVSPPTVTSSTTPASTAVVNGATVNLGSAAVAVPATTTIYADAAKTTPLPAGSTALTVTYNNSVTSNSLAAFPGGFSMSQDSTGATLAAPAVFVTAGFVSIELAVTAPNGTVTQAKTFDKPLNVTIPIPSGTINPATKLPMKAGDTISVWSYDSTTGAWAVLKLTNGTIVRGTLGALDTSNNTFPVTFATDHLTYFSTGEIVAASESCTNATLTVAGAGGNLLTFQAAKVGGGWSSQMTLAADSAKPATATVSIGSAPATSAVVNAFQGTTLVGTATFANLCDSNTLTVTPATIASSTLNVTVRDVCDGKPSVFTLPRGVGVFATPGNYSVLTGTNGIATFPALTVGTSYTITVNAPYNYSATSTVAGTGNSITVDRTVTCQIITGT